MLRFGLDVTFETEAWERDTDCETDSLKTKEEVDSAVQDSKKTRAKPGPGDVLSNSAAKRFHRFPHASRSCRCIKKA